MAVRDTHADSNLQRVIDFLENHMIFDAYGTILISELDERFREYLSSKNIDSTIRLRSIFQNLIMEHGAIRTSETSSGYYRGIRPLSARERDDLATIKGEQFIPGVIEDRQDSPTCLRHSMNVNGVGILVEVHFPSREKE